MGDGASGRGVFATRVGVAGRGRATGFGALVFTVRAFAVTRTFALGLSAVSAGVKSGTVCPAIDRSRASALSTVGAS